jgi:glycosyltransferase involved in cell wall biosynthesis
VTRTVVFVNDYSMQMARDGWLAGHYPQHHLWGAEHVAAAGHRVLYAQHRGTRLDRLFVRKGFPAGDPWDQWHVVRRWRDAPVALSAYSYGLVGLARLRGMHAWPWPVVSTIHPGLPRARELSALRHHDVVITISALVRDQLVEQHGRTSTNTHFLPWGPDLAFPGYASNRDDGFVVSSGKAARDIPTLLHALARTGTPAKVRLGDTPMSLPPGAEPLPDAHFAHFIPLMARSAVVCIPLSSASAGYGLTELNDALALAKPVIVTRNPYLEPDVERVGCGIAVDQGDVAGWREALSRLMGDPALRLAMGTAGRRYAEAHHNADLYGRGVAELISSL